jgi:hypothetical protein
MNGQSNDGYVSYVFRIVLVLVVLYLAFSGQGLELLEKGTDSLRELVKGL